VSLLTTDQDGPYLKYALFCRDTEELADGNLVLKEIIDLIDLPAPKEAGGPDQRVVAEVDVQLAFCIGGATPGPHRLLVAIKAPGGAPLDLPPPQLIEWEEGILFQRWIKLFRIPVQQAGLHVAAILLDGVPLGEGSFLVRFKAEEPTGD
jgi:hypothetical protein